MPPVRTALALVAAAIGLAGAAVGPRAMAQAPGLDRGEIVALWSAAERAGDHGLATGDLSQIARGLRFGGPEAREAAQAALVREALAYAGAQHGGRVDPALMPEEWAIRAAPYDVSAAFAEARRQGRLGEWAAGLAPQLPAYRALLERRDFYAAVAAGGGWTPIAAGAMLRPGDADARTPGLRARLAIEGYSAAPATAPDIFDRPLSDELARYQADRGLDADGLLGPETLAALNAPASDIVRRIDVNLERLRWLPRAQAPTRVEVNAPSMELAYFENGAEALRMRAIVGTRTNRTPMLETAIDAVILNPSWLVPESIARNEILPAAGADPTYLERNGYVLSEGRIEQRPGPGNMLGRIKFEAPNRFGVYLHDTPSPQLFAQAERALSHGCVRLERPRDLAAALLRSEGWTPEAIEAAIAAGATVRAPLSAPVPLHFLYVTARVEQGRLRLFPDIYGWDAALDGLLASGRATAAARTAVSLCSALSSAAGGRHPSRR